MSAARRRATGRAAPATEFGARPELAWIDVALLDVDASYQRSVASERSQALIEQIARGFRWAAFQAILATPAPGKPGHYLVIDGQHRVAAARRCGLCEVPAVVVAECAVDVQAASFVAANAGRVAVTAMALHRARCAAGDKAALAVAAACKAAGIRIAASPSSRDMKPGDTLALGTIARLVAEAPADLSALVLDTVARAYDGVARGLSAAVIRAAWSILSADRGRAAALRAALGARSPSALRQLAIGERANGAKTEMVGTERALRRLIGADGVAPSREANITPAPPREANSNSPPPRHVGAASSPIPVRVPSNPPRAPDPAQHSARASCEADQQAQIAAHVAQKGVVRGDAAVTAESVMNELRRTGAMVTAQDEGCKCFVVDRRHIIDREQLLWKANGLRQARGLPLLRESEVAWRIAVVEKGVSFNQRGHSLKAQQAMSVAHRKVPG